ncbi:hypothetical protein FOL47_001507, partial [Perkinsus chesapeaki]
MEEGGRVRFCKSYLSLFGDIMVKPGSARQRVVPDQHIVFVMNLQLVDAPMEGASTAQTSWAEPRSKCNSPSCMSRSNSRIPTYNATGELCSVLKTGRATLFVLGL